MKYTFLNVSPAAKAALSQSAEQRERAMARRARYLAGLSPEDLAAQRGRQRDARRRAAARRIAREKPRVCPVCGYPIPTREIGARGRPRELCDSPNAPRCKRIMAALSALRAELPRIEWYGGRGAKIRVANALNDIVRDNLGTGLPGADYYKAR